MNIFDEQFALENVGLDTLVDDVRMSPVSLRSQGFLKFVSLVLHWFKVNPTLSELHLLSSTKPIVTNEGDVDIIVRHNFTIHLTGSTLGRSPSELNKLLSDTCIDFLPYSKMGGGSFKFNREDALMQAFLNLSADDVVEYRAILQQYGYALHMSFGTLTLRSEVEYVPK